MLAVPSSYCSSHRIAFRSVAGRRIAVEHERPALEIEEGGFDTDEAFERYKEKVENGALRGRAGDSASGK